MPERLLLLTISWSRPALLACILTIGQWCFAAASYAEPAAVRLVPVSSPIAQFDFVEVVLEIDQPDFQNPFTDVEVRGEFTRGSRSVQVTGFCDAADGSVYRVRFMPSEPGDYSFRITLTAPGTVPKDISTHSGSFRVTKSTSAGPVRVDPKHPFHFVRQGSGEHWFWNGTTAYQLLAWDDATIVATLDRLKSLGVNRVRIALAARTKNGERWMEPLVQPTDRFAFKVEPWIAAHPVNIENPEYDVERFNLPMFQKSDRLLRAARDRDIIVSLIFYLDGYDQGVDPFGKQQAGGADEQRYYRYAVARFGAFANVMWDVTNEWHLFRDEAWVNQMGGLLHANDSNALLTSVHGEAAFPFRQQPWADFALYQCWDEHGGYEFMLKNRHAQAATGRPMPQINEEYGYEDHYPYPWGEKRQWPARVADNRRRLAWEISMAGCYQSTGERATDGVGAGPDTGGGWINGRGNDQMTMLLGYQKMKSFFTSLPWWELEPVEQLAGPATLLLAKPGVRYVAYVPRGGRASFELAAGNYLGRWFNPRTGQWSDFPPVKHDANGRWESPEPADRGDWALVLEAAR